MKKLITIFLVGYSFLVTFSNSQFDLIQISNAEEKQVEKPDFETLLRLAEQGDAEAQFKVGVKYDYGKDTPQEVIKAVEWYTKAAEQGHAGAQNNLGNLYFSGKYQDDGTGIAKDEKKGLEWLTKAAEQDFTFALNNLAGFYMMGIGVPRDMNKAIELYTKAAELGDQMATFTLAMLYYEGSDVVPKNSEKAFYWLTKAAEMGDETAQEILNEMKGIKKPNVKVTKAEDQKDFMNLNNIQQQITSDQMDCHRDGYRWYECMCGLEESYEDLKSVLERITQKNPEWEGMVLKYKKGGLSITTSLDTYRGMVESFEKNCTE